MALSRISSTVFSCIKKLMLIWIWIEPGEPETESERETIHNTSFRIDSSRFIAGSVIFNVLFIWSILCLSHNACIAHSARSSSIRIKKKKTIMWKRRANSSDKRANSRYEHNAKTTKQIFGFIWCFLTRAMPFAYLYHFFSIFPYSVLFVCACVWVSTLCTCVNCWSLYSQ